MVTIKEDCCGTPNCSWKEKLEQAYARATISINKITDQQGSVYYPDGTGNVQIPIPTSAQIAGIATMTEKIAGLEAGLKEETAERKAKDSEITEGLTNADMRITANAGDITAMKGDVATVKGDMKTLSDNEVAQNNRISVNESDITGIKEYLISDVSILDGATTGTMKVRIDRKTASPIDSSDYNLGRPVSAEIIQGTGPSMFKMQITLSSGVTIVSNDFVFTTEAIGQDVYISSFTFKAGNQEGYLSADIGLNNGVTIEANNFLIPTDPNVLATINDLGTRLTTAENNVTANMTEIADLKTSKVSVDQGTVNAGKFLGINTLGQVEPVEGGSSGAGEVWEELDITNLPNDWKDDTHIKMIIKPFPTYVAGTSKSWGSTVTSSDLTWSSEEYPVNSIIEIALGTNYNSLRALTYFFCSSAGGFYNTVTTFYPIDNWNNMTTSTSLFEIVGGVFTGTSSASKPLTVTRANITSYVLKMWRLKKPNL